MTHPVITLCNNSFIIKKGVEKLPLILGRVALITTGYGIREYMEDDCSNEYSSRNDDSYKNGLIPIEVY